MEKLANKIAETIAMHLGHDEEKTAVVSYGLAALLQMIIIFIVISAVGILGGFWAENLVMFFAVGLFRRATGGRPLSNLQRLPVYQHIFHLSDGIFGKVSVPHRQSPRALFAL